MFRILHLSDLHIRKSTNWSTTPILHAMESIVCQEANESNFDVVVFSGDIAFSGQADEYVAAREILERICLSPEGLNLNQEKLLLVPGNHDVERSCITPAMKAIEDSLSSVKKQGQIAAHWNDNDSMQLLLRKHEQFDHFCRELTGVDVQLSLPWSRTFEFAGKRIVFDGFNSSWLCRGSDDQRRLLIGQVQFNQVHQGKQDDFRIAVAHHPLSDLMEFDEQNCEENLRSKYQLFLRGHLHRPDTKAIQAANGSFVELAAGALHEDYESQNRFAIIDIPESMDQIFVKVFLWQEGNWIHDRNRFPREVDGIGKFEVSRRADIRHESDSLDVSGAIASRADEDKEKLPESFPRFNVQPSRQDLIIRVHEVAEVVHQMQTSRFARIHRESGTRLDGFLAAVMRVFAEKEGEQPTLIAPCNGIATGAALQKQLSLLAQQPVTQFGTALRDGGKCVLVLDGLEADGDSDQVTINETISAVKDFCPDLTIIQIGRFETEDATRVGALDNADTRAYIEASNSRFAPTSAMDYSRIFRATGGIPEYIDSVLEALSVTSLEVALAQLEDENLESNQLLSSKLLEKIEEVKQSTDELHIRANRLLQLLSVLQKGEALSDIRRLFPTKPLFAKHAFYLRSAGCLEIVEAIPNTQKAWLPFLRRPEKILRVPQPVANHVIGGMELDERKSIIERAAVLYFGADWRNGLVRMRRRIAFSGEISSHRSGNEISILRILLTENLFSGFDPVNLCVSYASQLNGKGFYGEACETAREFIEILENSNFEVDQGQLKQLQIIAGKTARMIGERADCIHYLSLALKNANESEKSDLLISMAMANESLGNDYEAVKAANSVLECTKRESGDYFLAKSIIVRIEESGASRTSKLKRLASRARNLGHHTAADNIVLELATVVDDTEQKLRYIAEVRSRKEREYNYVRATIRRVETLLDANRRNEITQLDRDDLWKSYVLAYTQRLSGIFNWCHRVAWRYLEGEKSDHHLYELFMHSSFVWRLNGEYELEREYMERLQIRVPDSQAPGMAGHFVTILDYCRARLLLIANQIGNIAN